MQNDNFPEGTFLHAEDLLDGGQWTERTAVIAAVHAPGTTKSADGKPIEKAVLSFEKTAKRMVLGKINTRLIKCAIGSSKASEWVGKSITIYAAKGNWFGQTNVAAIRVRVPDGRAKPFLKPSQLGEDLTGIVVR